MRRGRTSQPDNDDFLSLVLYKLRAPLNVIAGWPAVSVKAAEQTPGAAAAVRKAVRPIKRYCQVQAQLILGVRPPGPMLRAS